MDFAESDVLSVQFRPSGAKMPHPPQTKPCTFSHCEGRMISTRVEIQSDPSLTIAFETAHEIVWQWVCDRDDSHVENQKATD
jgi:hypothetical protein